MKKARNHLEESNMHYWKHFFHSVKQSSRLLAIAGKSLLHGIFPQIYANAGPLGIYKIYKEIKNLHHVQKMFKRHEQQSS